MGQMFWLNTRSGIHHGQLRLPGYRIARNQDLYTAAPRKFQGIVDQIQDYLPQMSGIAADPDFIELRGSEFHSLSFGHSLKHIDRLSDDAVESNRIVRPFQPSRITLGKQEQLLHKISQMGTFIHDRFEEFAIFLGASILIQSNLGRTADGSERGSQFVGDICQKVVVMGKIIGNAIEKAVDRGGKLIDFIAGIANG